MTSNHSLEIKKAVLSTFENYLSREDVTLDDFVRSTYFFANFFVLNPTDFLYLQKLDSKIEQFKKKIPPQNSQITKNRTLHVATQIYKAGGHTKVIENWIRYQNKSNHDLVLVSQYVDYSMNLPEGCKIIEINPTDSVESKILFLNDLYSIYSKVIFHIQPYDVLPLISMGNEDISKFSFYNHTDHVFNVGPSLVPLTYDMSLKGSLFSLNFRGAQNSKVVPVPLFSGTVQESEIEEIKNIPENAFIILSIGSEYKFKTNTDSKNLLKFADSFCNENKDCYFVFIGPGTHLKTQYQLMNENIILLGNRSYGEVVSMYERANVYVDSYPIIGGIASLEAAMYRCPTITFQNDFNCFDSVRQLQISWSDLNVKIKLVRDDIVYREELIEKGFQLASSHRGGEWLKHFHNPNTTFTQLSDSILSSYCRSLSEKYPNISMPNFIYHLKMKVIWDLLINTKSLRFVGLVLFKQVMFDHFYEFIISIHSKFNLKRFFKS